MQLVTGSEHRSVIQMRIKFNVIPALKSFREAIMIESKVVRVVVAEGRLTKQIRADANKVIKSKTR